MKSAWRELERLQEEEDGLVKRMLEIDKRKRELWPQCARWMGMAGLDKFATEKERQLIDILFKYPHFRNKELAQELKITERTVKFHVSNILVKFGASNRFELMQILKKEKVCNAS